MWTTLLQRVRLARRPFRQRRSERATGSSPSVSDCRALPPGFDSTGFLQAAKSNFVLLQEAWDRADPARLQALMTDGMWVHVEQQLRERGERPNRTDVVILQAELLGVENLGDTWLATVEFSGMIREEVTSGARPFRELWCLTKPADGSVGWLLANMQALH